MIASLPLKDVVKDIADAMDKDFEDICGIFSVSVPARLGNGSVTGLDFDNGLGLVRYECLFDRDTQFEFSTDRVHPVRFLL